MLEHLPPELRRLIMFKVGFHYDDAAAAVRTSRLVCVAWAREIMPLLLAVMRDEAEHRRFLKREKAQQSAALGRMSRAHGKKLALALTPQILAPLHMVVGMDAGDAKRHKEEKTESDTGTFRASALGIGMAPPVRCAS